MTLSKKAFTYIACATLTVLTALILCICAATAAFADDSNNSRGTCTATVEYYEYAYYEDPMYPADEEGRIALGKQVIEGLNAGDVLDAWDYVIDIPGHFFFDGWPALLTISEDPAENVFTFFYFKKHEYEYTVNYYMMLGADLTADSWAGALAPEGVEFIKFDSETFTDQRINKLIKGDEYQHELDGLYVIDTYPAEIRVGFEADDNVLNVLYTPDSLYLPDDWEIPADRDSDIPANGPSDGSDNDSPDSPSDSIPDVTPPADGSDDASGAIPPANGSGDNSDSNTPSAPAPTLPPDESMDKDDLIQLLPEDIEIPEDSLSQGSPDDLPVTDIDNGNDTDNEDSSGNGNDSDSGNNPDNEGNLDNDEAAGADEATQNPIDKEQLQPTTDADKTGLVQGNLAHTNDDANAWMYIALGVSAVAVILLMSMIALRKSHSRNRS